MNKSIYVSIMLLILVSTLDSMCQTTPPPKQLAGRDYINHTKYWFYRNRLVNEFMKVGPDQGESTPLATNGKAYVLTSVNGKPFLQTTRICDAGDGTLRSGGYYIGVLATEYYLLKNNGQDYNKTLQELYFALNAMKRLDETAETYNFCNASNGLPKQKHCDATGSNWNGFMIRDDMDCDPNSALTKYFRNKFSTDSLFLSTELCMNLYKTNTFYNNGDIYNHGSADDSKSVTNNDISQDQVNFLTIGMALVQRCLDGSESYNGTNLKSFAKDIISKILGHMATGAPVGTDNCIAFERTAFGTCGLNDNPTLEKIICAVAGASVCTIPGIQYEGRFPWMIENTVTKQASCITTDGASYTGFMSGGYAPATAKLTGNQYFVAKGFKGLWDIYNLGSLDGTINIGKIDDGIQILTQAAIGDSWNVCLIPKPCMEKVCILKLFGKCRINLKLPIFGTDCGCAFGSKLYDTKRSLDKQSLKGHYEILPLLHNILYNKTGYFESDLYGFYSDMIDKAPSVGPYCLENPNNLGTSIPAPYGWASLYMIDQASGGDNGIWYNGANTRNFWGEYNGLDYMLMYNLYNMYNIQYDQNYKYYTNYDDNLYIHNRTITSPEYYNARSYFDVTGIVNNGNITLEKLVVKNTYVDVRAGNSIKITSGVHIIGSQMHGYIYQPAKNWDWEMTLSSSFNPSTNRPDGYRMGLSQDPPEDLTYDKDSIQFVTEQEGDLSTQLGTNIPNPSSNITNIPYCIGLSGVVELVVTDIYGKEINKLVNSKFHEKGNYEVELDASNFEPGVYMYTLKAPGYCASKKMIVIR